MDVDCIRNFQKSYYFAGQPQDCLTDLGASQEQKAKHKGPGKEQLGVLTLETQTGGHAPQGLEHQVAQQQRPAHSQKDLLYVPHDGDMAF